MLSPWAAGEQVPGNAQTELAQQSFSARGVFHNLQELKREQGAPPVFALELRDGAPAMRQHRDAALSG
jgi:hypothetical protein